MASPNLGVNISLTTQNDYSKCCPRKLNIFCCCCKTKTDSEEDRRIQDVVKKTVSQMSQTSLSTSTQISPRRSSSPPRL
jgi:hypothetical protein